MMTKATDRPILFDDAYFMRIALQEAKKAYEEKEVPVGAVIVSNNRIIAKAHNQVEQLKDATAHAEMLALTSAFNHVGGKYLKDCTLYVTLEPCLMCANATFWAKLSRIVFATSDPGLGYSRLGCNKVLHSKTKVQSGVLELACQNILQLFFAELRESS